MSIDNLDDEVSNKSQLPDHAATLHWSKKVFIEFIFMFLGVGVLLPWNAYISAKPYFQSRLCDEDSQENEIGQNIEHGSVHCTTVPLCCPLPLLSFFNLHQARRIPRDS